jgi:hypothetical protein
MPQQQQQEEPITLSTTINFVYIWAAIQTACVVPFLRTGMGKRALGWLGPLALVYMLCYAALRPCPLLIPYIPAWLVMCALQKLAADRSQHSRYLGFPLPCRLPLVPGENAGRFLEAVLIAGVAIVLMGFDRLLGEFAALSCGGLVVKLITDRLMREKRLDDLRDAERAQRAMMNMYRNIR